MNKVRRALTSAVFAALLACTFAMVLDLPNSTASSSIFVSNDTYDDWAMFRHDPIHTGYSPSIGPDTNATLWTQTIGKTMYTGTLRSPAVAYGRLYVGDDEWRIHCLNASTGSPIWNYTTGSYVSACPAIAYGRVFVGSCDGTVYCLDAYTGRSIWNYTTEQPVQSSATVSDGRVYFGSWDHNVYCLSASTGAKIWNYTADIAVFSSPAVADGRVYVASLDSLYCLDASTGAKVWNYSVGDDETSSSPTVVGGRVYFAAYEGEIGGVLCLDSATGAKVWNYTMHDWSESSPAVSDGKVYIGTERGQIICFNASTGKVIWGHGYQKRWDSIFQDSSPAVTNDKVYMVIDRCLHCYRTSGVEIWSYVFGEGMLASPVVANGIVYVGPGYDGKVYAFGSQLVDDFESGSFDAWTGTVLTSGETASVLTKTAYRGTHAARFTSNGGGGYENAFCNKTLTADELYVRGYFNVSQSGINSDNDRLFLIVLRSGSDGLAYAGWKRTAGATKWCITMRDGTSYIDTFSNLTTSPSTSRWYNVELHWKKDPWDGLAELWVDGSLVCSSMGRNTSAYSGVSRVQFGLGELYGCGSTTVYSDSARITNEHIGPEPKATSSLSIRLSSNVITLGQVALISGSLLPAKPSSNVSIKYHFNRVASWSNLTTVKTDASGNYSYDWAPAEVGSYEVRASWEGDEGTLPSQSQVITLDIDETTIPEIQAPMILPLMALATLLVTILTRRSSEHAIPSTARAYRHLLLAGHPTPLIRILQ